MFLTFEGALFACAGFLLVLAALAVTLFAEAKDGKSASNSEPSNLDRSFDIQLAERHPVEEKHTSVSVPTVAPGQRITIVVKISA